MLVNSSLTVYHKVLDEETRMPKWERHLYYDVWWFGGKGASVNKGYENANDVEIRIPYELNPDLNIENFSIGDILVKGIKHDDIKTQQDLPNKEIYNITSINNNTFGNNKHVHIGGK